MGDLPKQLRDVAVRVAPLGSLSGDTRWEAAELMRKAAAALAAQQDGVREAWQPIETAENDNVVWVCNPNEGTLPVLAWKIENTWYEYGVYGKQLRPMPTYWMKWPKLPKVSAVEQGEKA